MPNPTSCSFTSVPCITISLQHARRLTFLLSASRIDHNIAAAS
jgi:hypothetical protein